MQRTCYLHITYFIGLVFLCSKLNAQQPLYHEEVYSPVTAEVNLVNGIGQDVNNCIWFTTQTGLYRYDGSRFRHFSVLNTGVLQFERMAGMPMLLDEHGMRWCMEDAKGYLYEVDSLSRVRPLQKGSSPQIIFSTIAFPFIIKPDQKVNAALQAQIEEISVVKTGNMLYLSCFNGELLRITRKDFLSGGKGTLLYINKDGYKHKVFATRDRFYFFKGSRLLCWNNDAVKPFTALLTGDIMHRGIAIDEKDFFAYKTSDPDIILVWHKGNIYRVEGTANSIDLHTTLLANTTVTSPPQALFYSPVQQLLISHYLSKGLTFYRPMHFSLLQQNYPPGKTVTDDYHYVVLPYQDGFITVNNTGLVWLGRNGGSKVLTKESISRFFIFTDRAGNIWYQRNSDFGLCYLQAGTLKSVPVCTLGKYMGFSGMIQQDDSSYLVLTRKTLKKIVVKDGKATRVMLLDSMAGPVEYNMLYALNSRKIWLGSDRGLLVYDAAGNNITPVPQLKNVYIRSATRLAENNYLLGTYDNGIYQYMNNTWIHLNGQEKNIPSSAHGFVTDKLTSSVWSSNNEGIIQIPLKQLLVNRKEGHIEFRHFTKFAAGISTEFNGSSNVSGAKLSDTSIVFANARGLVSFNPAAIKMPPLPVNILIEPLNETDDTAAQKNDAAQLQFRPVVPYFGNLADLEVLYRVTGADEKWNRLSSNSFINYNNLGPGNHKLQFSVREYDQFGDKQLLLTARDFNIPYPWYRKTWFIAAASVLLVLFFFLLHNLRLWYILKRKRQLRQLVTRKTKELQETNESLVEVIRELSESETNLKQSNFLKDQYYAVLTHDLRSPLKFLSFNLSRMLNQLPVSDSKMLKEGLFVAYECSNELEKLVEEFVYWIRNNDDQLVLLPVNTDIGNVIRDVQKIYGYGFEANHNVLEVNIPEGLQLRTDARIFFIIIRNTIDNANKYTHNGTISIKATKEDDRLLLTVSDNGHGMTQEMVQEFLNIEQQSKKDFKQRASMGAYIMNILTKKIGGSYDISSVKDKGTTVSFTFPEIKA